jgi:hypothetical protein
MFVWKFHGQILFPNFGQNAYHNANVLIVDAYPGANPKTLEFTYIYIQRRRKNVREKFI